MSQKYDVDFMALLKASELDMSSKPVRVRKSVHKLLRDYCEDTEQNMSSFTSIAIIEKIEQSIKSNNHS